MARPRPGRAPVCALALLVLLATTPGSAASFRGLEHTATHDGARVEAVNANGDAIVGRVDTVAAGNPQFEAAIWDEATHALEITGPSPVGFRRTRATGQETSDDGQVRRTIGWTNFSGGGGSGDPDEAWIRVEDALAGTDTITTLAPYPSAGAENRGLAISRDGHRLAEYDLGAGNVAYFYDPAAPGNGYTDIPDLDAQDMDAEGRRVVGIGTATAADRAILWEAATATRRDLGLLAGGTAASALAISPSGLIVVGDSESSNVSAPLREAFRWHSDFGMLPLHPVPAGESFESVAHAASDANIVVGAYRHAGGSLRAFLWTPSRGREDLKDWIESTYGLDLTGWTLHAATAISADGRVIAGDGTNPDGFAQDWVFDSRDENRAVIRVRPVNVPTDFELFLQCGDTPLSAVAFGLVPAEPFPYNGNFDFAGCNNPVTVGGQPAFDCTGAGGIGPTVADTSYVYEPQETDDVPIENVREAAFYLRIEGDGGPGNLLCEPGDAEIPIGSFFLDQPYGDLVPVISPYQFAIGQNASGDFIDDAEFLLEREREPGGVAVEVRPEVDDPDGIHWTVTLDAPIHLSTFSFGLIVPPTANTEVSFGDCNESLGGIYGARECANGLEMGSNVDFTTVRTFGPDEDLFNDFGLRPDTLYVYVEGAMAGLGTFSELNAKDRKVELGRFTFEGTLSSEPGFHPVPTFEAIEDFDQVSIDVDDWSDENGFDQTSVVFVSGPGTGPGPDADTDGDGFGDAHDLCPYVTSNQGDGGTLEQFDGMGAPLVPPGLNDGVGMECQCGETENDGQVVLVDVDALRNAMLDPAEALTLDADTLRRCNAVGPVALSIDPDTNLQADCDINDIFVLMRARDGLPPLISVPGEIPACPNETTP